MKDVTDAIDASLAPFIRETHTVDAAQDVSIRANLENIQAVEVKALSQDSSIIKLNRDVSTMNSRVSDVENSLSQAESKLSSIENGAQKNVQSDWNATTGDASILNRPEFGALAFKDHVTAVEVGAIPTGAVGIEGGVAPLNSNRKIDAEYLPSYVDDVVEGYFFNNKFWSDAEHRQVITPSKGVIYVDLHTDNAYRWGGSEYVLISHGAGVDVRNYGRALTWGSDVSIAQVDGVDITARLPHMPEYTKEDVGLDRVDNTPDAEKSVLYAESAGSADVAGSVDWNDVSGRPETYVPSAHTHSTADIDILDGYEKPEETSPIIDGDTLNQALGKLEKAVEGKQDAGNYAERATTLAGYGITDAAIDGGVITIGETSIKPLTEHQDLSDYAKKHDVEIDYAKKVDVNTKFLDYLTEEEIEANYVRKDSSKGLSDNNYTDEDKNKLAGIEAEAQKNVNADWNAADGDAKILNKPTTIAGYGITDAKIENGEVVLGNDSIKPLTEHQDISNLATKQEVADGDSSVYNDIMSKMWNKSGNYFQTKYTKDGKTAMLWNENDGGGVMFTDDVNKVKTFVGVNDGGNGASAINAQIYAKDTSANVAARLNVNTNGIYYAVSPTSIIDDAHELAVKGDIDAAVSVKADADSVYTKTEADEKFLIEHQDVSYLATKEEVAAGLAEKADVGDCYTKEEADDKFLTEHQDLSDYAKKSEIPTKVSAFENDAEYLVSADVSNLATKTELNETVAMEIAKVIADAPEDFDTLKEVADYIASDKTRAAEIENAISALESDKADASTVYTKTEVYTKEEVDDIVEAEHNATVARFEDASALIDTKADASTVYTKTEADEKFLTEHQDISNLATKTEVATGDSSVLSNILKRIWSKNNANPSVGTFYSKYTNGNSYALIFNESDGGGSQYYNNDTSVISYVGTNNGDGSVYVQIYSKDKGTGVGTRLNVNPDGIYFTNGKSTKFGEEDRLVVRKDVSALETTIDSALELKADKTDVSALEESMNEVLAVKADKSEVSDLEQAVAANLDLKADASTVYTKDETYTKSEIDTKDTSVLNNILGRIWTSKSSNPSTGHFSTKLTNNRGNEAMIFNESDGGGAMFTNKVNGTKSYVGVNEETDPSSGVHVQIYSKEVSTNRGSRLNANPSGIYYGVGTSAQIDAAHELAVKGDVEAAVAPKANADDVYTKIESDAKFLVDNDISTFATRNEVAEAVAPKANAVDVYTKNESDANDTSVLTNVLKRMWTSTSANPSTGCFHTQLTNANGSKAIIFNESDGGGVIFEDNKNNLKSFVGVNDGADPFAGILVQIYSKNVSTNVGSRLNVNPTGMYYGVGTATPIDAAHELAVKGDIPTQVSELINDSSYLVPADIEGKSDKTATVSDVSYDSSRNAITMTINGVVKDVLTIEKIESDIDLDDYATITEVENHYVKKVSGKGLSTNDYTTDEKNKLHDIAANAEVNQNAFSNVGINGVNIDANRKTDVLVIETTNITATGDDDTNKITLSVTASDVSNALGYIPMSKNTTYVFAQGETKGQFKVTDSDGSVFNVPVNGVLTEHQTVSLASGTDNGTLKLIVGDASTDNIQVKGLKSLAFTESLNAENVGAIPSASVGVAGGVASLDSNGHVPSNQLPSFVDDVIEGYLHNGKFYEDDEYTEEITPESGKIYVDLSTDKTYRWGGSTYVVISETLAVGTTEGTAYDGAQGKRVSDTLADHVADSSIHITSTERTQWDDAAAKKHEHTNKSVIDGISSGDITNWNNASTNTHVHDNKSVLDAITQNGKDSWDDAASKKHEHSNKTVIDSITQNMVNSWQLASQKTHDHLNKGVIDAITTTDVSNWNDASTKKHEHVNKSVIDGITAEKVAKWDAGSPEQIAFVKVNVGDTSIVADSSTSAFGFTGTNLGFEISNGNVSIGLSSANVVSALGFTPADDSDLLDYVKTDDFTSKTEQIENSIDALEASIGNALEDIEDSVVDVSRAIDALDASTDERLDLIENKIEDFVTLNELDEATTIIEDKIAVLANDVSAIDRDTDRRLDEI